MVCFLVGTLRCTQSASPCHSEVRRAHYILLEDVKLICLTILFLSDFFGFLKPRPVVLSQPQDFAAAVTVFLVMQEKKREYCRKKT